MATPTISALSSALVARQSARKIRPRPWLSSSKVSPSSTSSTVSGRLGQASRMPRGPDLVSALPSKRPTTTTVTFASSFWSASSSLLARASRDRPWQAQSSKPAAPAIIKSDLIVAPAAAPAVIKPRTTAAWVQSQAIDLRHALLRPSPPKRFNSWLMSQAISPRGVLTSISVPSASITLDFAYMSGHHPSGRTLPMLTEHFKVRIRYSISNAYHLESAPLANLRGHGHRITDKHILEFKTTKANQGGAISDPDKPFHTTPGEDQGGTPNQ